MSNDLLVRALEQMDSLRAALEAAKATQSISSVTVDTRTQRAQDDSFEKYGANHYMRMIEAYAFASRLEQELSAAQPVVPQSQRILVTKEGVAFGKNCWFSHENITGATVEQLNAGVGVINRGYMQWVSAMLFAAPAPLVEQVHELVECIRDDFIEHSHPDYGDGYFCTPDVFSKIFPVAATAVELAQTTIDPQQDPMRPGYFMNYAEDETPAEMVLRKLACWLGVGGYNAPEVDAEVFHRKIIFAIEHLNTASPAVELPVVAWLQSGSLLYRLTDERHPTNCDEINVTMADNSRDLGVRTKRASEILAAIAAQGEKK